jgi:cell division septation protein DedD
MHPMSRRLLFTSAVSVALTCLNTLAHAQDAIARPLADTAPAAANPPTPNMLQLNPAWGFSAPVAGFDATKSVRTVRIKADSPPKSPAVVDAPVGLYVVQVSAQRTEEDARTSFAALQTKYAAVLGDQSPLIERADLGDRGVYFRVYLGPFDTAEDANDLCGRLKLAGGQCIVQEK